MFAGPSSGCQYYLKTTQGGNNGWTPVSHRDYYQFHYHLNILILVGGKSDTFPLFVKQVLHQENYEIKSLVHLGFAYFTVVIGLFKVTRTMCEICSKLTIKTPDVFSNVSVVEFEQVNDFRASKFVTILLKTFKT